MKFVARQWVASVLLTTALCSLFVFVQSQRVILSSVNVYALKTRATYSCSAAQAIEAQWYLNGTDSRELNLTNTTSFFFTETNVGIFIFLYLTGDYNNTHIQCEALFPSGPPERSGNNKTLVIQGYLSSVGNLNYTLMDDNLTLSWDAPFSLDIPRISVDITYCVTIASSQKILHSQCDIQNAQYHYRYNQSFLLCAESSIAIITPVNIVGNGTTNTIHIEFEREYTCTEATTAVTAFQQSSTFNSNITTLENSTHAPNIGGFDNSASTNLNSQPKVYTTLIAAVVGVFATMAGVIAITTVIFIMLYFIKFKARRKTLKERNSKSRNGQYYDTIADGSTDDHIYDEIKGKLSKSFQFNIESNMAYASHSRIDSHQVQDYSADKERMSASETPAADFSSHYEKIAEDRNSKNSHSSDISVTECPAYVTVTSNQ